MDYNCADRGSVKCPCHLTTAGQCYACGMLRTGECGCSTQWNGSCPYSEFVMNGSRPQPLPILTPAEVVYQKKYSANLTVVRLEVPAGFAQQCHRLGTYIMAQIMGYMVPLSVLKSSYAVEKRRFLIGPRPYIELAVQPIGVKTMQMVNPLNSFWSIQGPFYSGLQSIGSLDSSKPLLVIAKGTALAPFLNIAANFAGENPAKINLFVDNDKLTSEFVSDYVSVIGEKKGKDSSRGKIRFNYIDLSSDMEMIMSMLDMYDQIMFLASPYYTNQVIRRLRASGRLTASVIGKGQSGIAAGSNVFGSTGKCLVVANHANICCGLGICGSCSHTDKDGQTVKKCKCIEGGIFQ